MTTRTTRRTATDTPAKGKLPPRRKGRPCRTDTVPREHILATAARLFHDRGYQATTVRDVAAAVGISAGSLFHHFPSKEQMLVEMLREASISLCAGAEAVTAGLATSQEKLLALIRYELTCLVGDKTRHQFAVLISEWRDVPPAIRPELQMLRRRYFGVWMDVLNDCYNRGLLRLEPDAALRIVHGADQGSVTWFRAEGKYSIAQFALILTNLILVSPIQPGG
jgi:AcrR family transcriptional regulator